MTKQQTSVTWSLYKYGLDFRWIYFHPAFPLGIETVLVNLISHTRQGNECIVLLSNT
jgi:hypothetical protein